MKINQLDSLRAIQGPELDYRLDCYGNFELQDDVCREACALRLSCAIVKNQNLSGQLAEDNPGPELTTGWRDFV
ncbi:MAG: hypothetical protein LBR11_09850 [Deltaproteobacteria bacterium]|jgi:hypothetical protein|nr:hypothetical protein [Deltaproteobacteria bacterium]